MAVKTKDELLSAVNGLEIEEDTKISLLEDITDTVDSFSTTEDWKKKYEENDAMWKEKYRERFFNTTTEEEEEMVEEEKKPLSFNDLFKTV